MEGMVWELVQATLHIVSIIRVQSDELICSNFFLLLPCGTLTQGIIADLSKPSYIYITIFDKIIYHGFPTLYTVTLIQNKKILILIIKNIKACIKFYV